jgi:hypothetical protein
MQLYAIRGYAYYISVRCNRVGGIFLISVNVGASTAVDLRRGNRKQSALITRLTETQAEGAVFGAETKDKYIC